MSIHVSRTVCFSDPEPFAFVIPVCMCICSQLLLFVQFLKQLLLQHLLADHDADHRTHDCPDPTPHIPTDCWAYAGTGSGVGSEVEAGKAGRRAGAKAKAKLT